MIPHHTIQQQHDDALNEHSRRLSRQAIEEHRRQVSEENRPNNLATIRTREEVEQATRQVLRGFIGQPATAEMKERMRAELVRVFGNYLTANTPHPTVEVIEQKRVEDGRLLKRDKQRIELKIKFPLTELIIQVLEL